MQMNQDVGGWLAPAPSEQEINFHKLNKDKLHSLAQSYPQTLAEKQRELEEAKSSWFFSRPTQVEMLEQQIKQLPNDFTRQADAIRRDDKPLSRVWENK